MIRLVLLAAGLVSLSGCYYYTFYPKYWVPVDCRQSVDDQAIAKERADCRMAAMDRKYPDRGDYFAACMTAKGYAKDTLGFGREACP